MYRFLLGGRNCMFNNIDSGKIEGYGSLLCSLFNILFKEFWINNFVNV